MVKDAGDILSSGDIEMSAVITQKIFGRETNRVLSEIKIGREGKIEINIDFTEAKIKLTCQNEL